MCLASVKSLDKEGEVDESGWGIEAALSAI